MNVVDIRDANKLSYMALSEYFKVFVEKSSNYSHYSNALGLIPNISWFLLSMIIFFIYIYIYIFNFGKEYVN